MEVAETSPAAEAGERLRGVNGMARKRPQLVEGGIRASQDGGEQQRLLLSQRDVDHCTRDDAFHASAGGTNAKAVGRSNRTDIIGTGEGCSSASTRGRVPRFGRAYSEERVA